MTEYNLTKEQVRFLAGTSELCGKVLRDLHPKAFEDEWVLVDPSRISSKIITSVFNEDMVNVEIVVDGRSVAYASWSGYCLLMDYCNVYRIANKSPNGETDNAYFTIYEKK